MGAASDKAVGTPGGAAPQLLRHPVQMLAFGFGSGLSPKAPGTVGTLVAVPLYWLMSGWGLLQYTAVVVLAALNDHRRP